MLLLGEYAVTEPDAPGVALGVLPEVRAAWAADGPPRITGRMGEQRFTWTPQISDSPLFAALVAECGPPRGAIEVDSGAFMGEHGKLGLGSSAAAAVAVAALLLHGPQAGAAPALNRRRGREPPPDAQARAPRSPALDRRRVFAAALAAHRAAQGGRGSGYDVAASVWGGVVRFTGGRTPAVKRHRPQVLPQLCLVAGAEPLATPAAVACYERWRQTWTRPPRRGSARDSRELVEQFMSATDTAACCAALSAGGELLRWLGARIGVAVEPPVLRARLSEFRARGWAAKPAGAGGELGVAAAPPGTPPAPGPAPYVIPLRLAPEDCAGCDERTRHRQAAAVRRACRGLRPPRIGISLPWMLEMHVLPLPPAAAASLNRLLPPLPAPIAAVIALPGPAVIEVHSQIPIGLGFGSSAALCAAAERALVLESRPPGGASPHRDGPPAAEEAAATAWRGAMSARRCFTARRPAPTPVSRSTPGSGT